MFGAWALAASLAAAPGQWSMVIGGGRLDVNLGPAPAPVSGEALRAWIDRSTRAVSDYFGGLPVASARLHLVTGGRGSIGGGMTWGFATPRIRVRLGERVTPEALARDWVLAHELVHLAFPDQDPAHAWAEEGLATYLEPVIRAQAGMVSEEDLWTRFLNGMPNGAAREGDGGLDGARSWGRKYWGGALFWLAADVELRERTAGRASLADGLRGVVDAGGNVSRSWPIDEVFRVADRATGTSVLTELYERYGRGGDRLDPAALFARLGVGRGRHGPRFSDDAPAARVRREIARRGYEVATPAGRVISPP